MVSKLQKLMSEGCVILENEMMSEHTSFRIGGPADVLVIPKTAHDIINTIGFARENSIELTVIGNGSNLLVRDGGIRGIVIKTSPGLGRISVDEDVITAEAGALLSRVSSLACSSGLTGLEFAQGIPGSVGGGVFMNAGAYDGELKNVIVSSVAIRPDGSVTELSAQEHQLSYRHSAFSENGYIIVSTKMRLKEGDRAAISEKMSDFSRRRREKQPLEMPSAGSTFKRPPGYFAGKLIEDSSLRGFRVGDAMVSEKHCGFVVNCGKATARDVTELIDRIKDKVYSDSGVMLECELKMIGQD